MNNKVIVIIVFAVLTIMIIAIIFVMSKQKNTSGSNIQQQNIHTQKSAINLSGGDISSIVGLFK